MLKASGRKYVPPYDAKEMHLPGHNYCGPGTNVTKRVRNGVQPMDALDQACYLHDLDLEVRGPQRVGLDPKAVRALDMRLASAAKKIALSPKSTKRQRAMAWVVHRAMLANKWRKSRRS